MGSSKLPSKLSDLRVLITRPQHQHASLCSAIEDHGGEAKHFPLFAIEAVSEPILVQQIKNKSKPAPAPAPERGFPPGTGILIYF